MFKIIEDNINSFLNLIEGISESDIQAIKDKYTISITDDMSKGHITSNICLILGSIHKANPKELSKDLCAQLNNCLLYTSPSPRDLSTSRMPSSA